MDTIETNEEHVYVYSDASKLDGSNGLTGCGFALYHMGQLVSSQAVGMGTHAENYDAELQGIALAMRAGVRTALSLTTLRQHVKHVHVFADSSAAVGRITVPSTSIGQKWMLATRYEAEAFVNLHPLHTVEVSWIPSHSNIPGNETADRLAKDGTQRIDHPWRSIANARRRLREQILKDWRTEWNANATAGGFAVADRIPPSLKPPSHFRSLRRQIYALTIQCRTRHAFLGEYYANHVPTEDTNCRCGIEVQTREHILRECWLYDDHRYILRAAVRDLSLPELLGTPKGIKAVASFIAKSGAFTKLGFWNEQDLQDQREASEEATEGRTGEPGG